jgi:TPR repeat protein
MNWYRRAAESGHYPSQARLGYCYAKGLGVANDPVEAFVWLSLASRHGVGLAMTELEDLVRTMSSDQKATAQQRLSRWIAASQRSEDVLATAIG